MRYILTFVLFFQSFLFTAETDFDVAIVGTSPIAMLEAIYHIHCNERVLVLEAEERCGGAWKSIDICGVEHADLGCHTIGSDQQLKGFFENYFGCKFLCLQHSNNEAVGEHAKCPQGFYFSAGCHELISKLKSVIDLSDHALLMNQRLDSIYIDTAQGHIELSVGCRRYTTAKLIITPASNFHVQNPHFINSNPPVNNYYHLYLLIDDTTPPRFTYLSGLASGLSRAMNLTPFLKMPAEGLQLIVIQTYGEKEFNDGDRFLEAFKSQGHLDANARIIASDTYVYHQTYSSTAPLLHLGGTLIEAIDTSSFWGMAKCLEKWKSVMVPVFHGREEGIEGLQ